MDDLPLVERMVRTLAGGLSVPVTVKIRRFPCVQVGSAPPFRAESDPGVSVCAGPGWSARKQRCFPAYSLLPQRRGARRRAARLHQGACPQRQRAWQGPARSPDHRVPTTSTGCPTACMHWWGRLTPWAYAAGTRPPAPPPTHTHTPAAPQRTVEYALMLERAGASLLAIHGRTREQKRASEVRAEWEHIRAVKQVGGQQGARAGWVCNQGCA